jgi:small subunit ribosomal protein S5
VKMADRPDLEEQGLKDKVIFINRVAKVVKGGKRFSFAALVVVGDKQGSIGVGQGKAAEVPEAIRKAVEKAKKQMIKISLKNTTIPYTVLGHFGAEDVLLKPASEGTGIIAGGPVRAVMDVLGVQNIIGKSLGSGNPNNVVQATLHALHQLRDPVELKQSRQQDLQEAD